MRSSCGNHSWSWSLLRFDYSGHAARAPEPLSSPAGGEHFLQDQRRIGTLLLAVLTDMADEHRSTRRQALTEHWLAIQLFHHTLELLLDHRIGIARAGRQVVDVDRHRAVHRALAVLDGAGEQVRAGLVA